MFETQLAIWQRAIHLVPELWRADFVRFVEEGESSEEFAVFFNSNRECQQAFELIMNEDRAAHKLMQVVGEEVETCEQVTPDVVRGRAG